MRLIATRVYELDGETVVDRLHAKGGSYALTWGAMSDERERVEIITADHAREWLSECPEQLAEVRERI